MKIKYFRSSTLALNKFIKSQKNLSKPSPKLFPNDNEYEYDSKSTQITFTLNPKELELDLNHHLLQKLELSCTSIKQFNQIHTQLIVLDLFQHPFVASRYIKKLCNNSMNLLSHCVYLYDYIEKPDAFMCNTIMKCFVNSNNNDPSGALRFYYDKMIANWVLPNHYTFPLVVKVCADVGSSKEGQKAHSCVVKIGFEFDAYVRNSLVHMYSVCGRVLDARVLFDNGFVLDLVSWNSMINGYVKNGDIGLARELFDEMPERDAFSWNSMISGYVGVGDMEAAQRLFDNMPSRDVVSWNCLIDGYAKIRNVNVARWFFDQMPFRNVVSWNIMLALYLKCKDYGECLKLFDRMIEEREVRPNKASLMSVLTACANFRRLDLGKWIHSYIRVNKVEPDELLLTALLTMYAKCGLIDFARHIFNEMPKKSVVSWNSMIMGYSINRQGEKALETFLEMEKNSIMPNAATFVSVLSACSHAGLLLEAWWYFDQMRRKYKIEPKVEHYGCMVDLLRQAGMIKQLEELLRKMHLGTDSTLFESFLYACRTCKYSELSESVAKQLIKMYPRDFSPHVLLLNIYAGAGKWDEVENMRKTMKQKGLEKRINSTLINLGEFGSEFVLEDGV